MGSPVPVNRIEAFSVTCSAGTTQAAPLTVATAFLHGVVTRIAITVPDGHNGLTGIQMLAAGAQAVPLTNNTYLVANNQTLEWNLTDQLDSGAWSARVFNTDVYDHTFYVRFDVQDFGRIAAPPAPVEAPLLT